MAQPVAAPDHRKAQRLVQVIADIHEGGLDVIGARWTLYNKMKALADRGDVEGMLEYYEACLGDPRGRWVSEKLARHGRKRLESEHQRFLAIYHAASTEDEPPLPAP